MGFFLQCAESWDKVNGILTPENCSYSCLFAFLSVCIMACFILFYIFVWLLHTFLYIKAWFKSISSLCFNLACLACLSLLCFFVFVTIFSFYPSFIFPCHKKLIVLFSFSTIECVLCFRLQFMVNVFHFVMRPCLCESLGKVLLYLKMPIKSKPD